MCVGQGVSVEGAVGVAEDFALLGGEGVFVDET
jgi:hypothetical protein